MRLMLNIRNWGSLVIPLGLEPRDRQFESDIPDWLGEKV
tara:strand:+ start:1624 stop:1740 length:117 start_codon:yes stop_codon:yes gene_type:complete